MKTCQINIASLCLCGVLSLSSTAFAQSPGDPVAGDKALSCDSLKQTIDEKLQSKGVKNYKLEVVDTAGSNSAKVVGRCDGGKHKVTYSKDSSSEAGH